MYNPKEDALQIVKEDALKIVDMPTADVDHRVVSAEHASLAERKLVELLPRVRGRSWRLGIYLEDGNAFLVDCVDGSVTPADRSASNDANQLDANMVLSSLDFLQLMGGMLDPRNAIIFSRVKVVGSTEVVTKFCDLLCGRDVIGKAEWNEAMPAPTTDLDLAMRQFEKFGYCIVANALDADYLERVCKRVDEQAAGERAAGRADGDYPNQRIWNAINKGDEFLELLEHPLIDKFLPTLLGDYALLSSCSVNIAGPGGNPQYLHTDQICVQPPIPEVGVGFNMLWMLDDVTEENGGTRLLPGSHRPGVAPDDVMSIKGTVAAEGPAGSVLIFDTRLWHGTGANKTDRQRRVILTFFVRYWMRTNENATVSLFKEVYDKMSDRVKIMHGFRTTGSVGAIDTHVEGFMGSRDPAAYIPMLDAEGQPIPR